MQPGGEFLLLRMTDLQLDVWVEMRRLGHTGWYLDATEGMVRGGGGKWEWRGSC